MVEGLDAYLDDLGFDDRRDRYVVDEVLKEGAFERTELVHEGGGPSDAHYVRKLIEADAGLGAAYARLWDAQQAGRRFSHLPRLVECSDSGGRLLVVMEFVEGETLERLVGRRGPSVALACEVFPKLCDAVSELHEGFDPPIVHRDLKPSNVMLRAADATGAPDPPRDIVIIDLGIARSFREGADRDTRHFGTRDYAPPEQFGFGQTDVRSDVFALGALLYFLLTGQAPDSKARDERFFHAMVPESLRQVVACACALDPAARFKSVAQLGAAFRSSYAFAAEAGPGADGDGSRAAPGAPNGADGSSRPPLAEGPASRAEAVHPTSDPSRAGAGGASFPDASSPPGRKRGFRTAADGESSKGGLPFVLSCAWNVLLVFLLVAIAASSVSIAAEEVAAGANVFDALSYAVLFFLFFCPVAFLLRSRRAIYALFPRAPRLSARQEALCFAVCFVLLFLYFLIAPLST